MKFLSLLLLAVLVSCASHKRIDHLSDGKIVETEIESVPAMGFAPAPELEEVEVKLLDKDLNVLEVKSFKGFTEAEIDRFWKYSDVVDNITHSDCFANYLKKYPDLLNNKNQSREELIEELRTVKPKLNFVMYYANNGTVGYTYANSDTIWMNRKSHRNYSLAESAANLGHERSHKLGYTHDFKRTSRRSDQVPYPVGAGIKACAYDINYDLGERERVKVCYRSWKSLWLKKYCYWKIK